MGSHAPPLAEKAGEWPERRLPCMGLAVAREPGPASPPLGAREKGLLSNSAGRPAWREAARGKTGALPMTRSWAVQTGLPDTSSMWSPRAARAPDSPRTLKNFGAALRPSSPSPSARGEEAWRGTASGPRPRTHREPLGIPSARWTATAGGLLGESQDEEGAAQPSTPGRGRADAVRPAGGTRRWA